MTDLTAALAGVEIDRALVDKDGCIWVHVGPGWSYLSEFTTISWDVHEQLPELYEPYRTLDAAATKLVAKAVKKSRARLP